MTCGECKHYLENWIMPGGLCLISKDRVSDKGHCPFFRAAEVGHALP